METIVALERQRVQLAENAYNAAHKQYQDLVNSGATQEEIEEAKLKMQKAQADVIKNQVGAQRSMMGKVFGNMIGSFRENTGVMGPITIMHDLKEYTKEKQQLSPTRKEVIHRFIGEFCDQKDLLDKLSRKLYLSVPRTIHVVKEETGHTFQQLRKAYQMRLAAARLRFSNESLSHVAVQCGFDNVSSLHRNFKKYFNLTPLAYRKQYDSDNEKFSDIIDTGDWPGRPY